MLAHRLCERLAAMRRETMKYLRPDGKTQVTFDYEDGRPVALKTVLISTQHQPGIDAETTIKVGWDDWQQMSAGQLDGMTAFMMGKLKVEGDMSNAMQLQGVLAKLRS